MSRQNQTIAIPPSTEFTIVFPSMNFDSKLDSRFDSSFYSPNLTDGKALTQEISQFLNDIEKAIKPFTSKIRRALYYLLLYIVLSFFVLLYFILTRSGVLIRGSVGYIVGIVVSILILAVYVSKIEEKMILKCQETTQRLNNNFVSRGLRWHLPSRFPRWIELQKDYKKAQGFASMSQFGDLEGQLNHNKKYIPPLKNNNSE